MNKAKAEKSIIIKDKRQILTSLHGEYVDKDFIMELLPYESKRFFNMLLNKSKDYNFRISTKEIEKEDDINITKYVVLANLIVFYNKKHNVVCVVVMIKKD